MKQISTQVLLSCFLAGCLEIYDFTIFAFLTSIIHKEYLTFLSEGNALIITYALFAVGFLFRPLGSLLFGYIGDKYGRKFALVTSVSTMGIASLTMFILPSYATIGIISCYIIALVRILQGISVGGEYSGAIIYAIEHFDKKKTGLVGSIVVSGCLCGVMLGRFVANIVQMPNVGESNWRLAFLFGFILSLIGYFIRKKLTESPEFLLLQKNKKEYSIPLLEGIKKFPFYMLSITILVGANGVSFYFVVVFLPNYIKNNGIDISAISFITTIIPAIFAPVFGWLSDKWSRGKLLLTGISLIGIYSILSLPIILASNSTLIVTLLIIGYALLFSIQSGTLNTFGIEIFPTECRFSCGALCYALGMALIGGTSPMVSEILIEYKGINGVVNYVSFITLLSFLMCSIIVIKSTQSKSKINNIDIREIKTEEKIA